MIPIALASGISRNQELVGVKGMQQYQAHSKATQYHSPSALTIAKRLSLALIATRNRDLPIPSMGILCDFQIMTALIKRLMGFAVLP
ncbi:UNVERIFIED_CONTAM: hypothetical protein K2H54_036794 [Gekko kuhli]